MLRQKFNLAKLLLRGDTLESVTGSISVILRFVGVLVTFPGVSGDNGTASRAAMSWLSASPQSEKGDIGGLPSSFSVGAMLAVHDGTLVGSSAEPLEC